MDGQYKLLTMKYIITIIALLLFPFMYWIAKRVDRNQAKLIK
jgi:hypothetical protein